MSRTLPSGSRIETSTRNGPPASRWTRRPMSTPDESGSQNGFMPISPNFADARLRPARSWIVCTKPSRSTTSTISPFGETRVPCSPNLAATGYFTSTGPSTGRAVGGAAVSLGRDCSGVHESTSTASAARAPAMRITPISTYTPVEGASELCLPRAQSLPARCVLPAALVDRLVHERIRGDREDRPDDPVRRLLPLREIHVEAEQLAGVLTARRDIERRVLECRLDLRLRRARAAVVGEADHRVTVAPRQDRARGQGVLEHDVAAIPVGDLELQRQLRWRLRREWRLQLRLLTCGRRREGDDQGYSS